MPKGAGQCDWVRCGEDTRRVVVFFNREKARLGQGGNPDTSLLCDCATYLATFGPPEHGVVKNAKSISGHWAQLRKLFDAILAVMQGTYTGASGWKYSHEHGFSVDAGNRPAWNSFVKTHSIFKPFATSGWPHWDLLNETLPARACGKYVFNAATAAPAAPAAPPPPPAPPQLQLPNQPTFASKQLQLLLRHDTQDIAAINGLLSLSQSNRLTPYDEDDFMDDYHYDSSQPISQWSQTQDDFARFSPVGFHSNYGLPPMGDTLSSDDILGPLGLDSPSSSLVDLPLPLPSLLPLPPLLLLLPLPLLPLLLQRVFPSNGQLQTMYPSHGRPLSVHAEPVQMRFAVWQPPLTE
ncbi:hypothetical protein C8F01DRAFT_1345840 [Mycena amicta]|nr:hypothetical protein C8F01DRAFT_1345840 [Mycena amicta]